MDHVPRWQWHQNYIIVHETEHMIPIFKFISSTKLDSEKLSKQSIISTVKIFWTGVWFLFVCWNQNLDTYSITCEFKLLWNNEWKEFKAQVHWLRYFTKLVKLQKRIFDLSPLSVCLSLSLIIKILTFELWPLVY